MHSLLALDEFGPPAGPTTRSRAKTRSLIHPLPGVTVIGCSSSAPGVQWCKPNPARTHPPQSLVPPVRFDPCLGRLVERHVVLQEFLRRFATDDMDAAHAYWDSLSQEAPSDFSATAAGSRDPIPPSAQSDVVDQRGDQFPDNGDPHASTSDDDPLVRPSSSPQPTSDPIDLGPQMNAAPRRKYQRQTYEPLRDPSLSPIDPDQKLKAHVEDQYNLVGHHIGKEEPQCFVDQYFPPLWVRCGMCKIRPCHYAERHIKISRDAAKDMCNLDVPDPVVVVMQSRPHSDLLEHTGGGESQRHINKNVRTEKRKMARQTDRTPSALESDAITANKRYIPKASAITTERSKLKKAEKLGAPGETPTNRQSYCSTLVQHPDLEPWDPWIIHEQACYFGQTYVPLTSKYLVDSIFEFYTRGMSQTGAERCLYLLGDGTHNQSRQKLKKIVFGFAGTNFFNTGFGQTQLFLACT